MSSAAEQPSVPDFEFDHGEEYGPYFLTDPDEISFHLHRLLKRGTLVSAHLDAGEQLFLTTLLAVDNETRRILLAPAQDATLNAAAQSAHKVTLIANLDGVKVQFRLTGLREESFEGQRALAAAMPNTMLRLQRREFFRLEPPLASPIDCRVSVLTGKGTTKTFEPTVADISAGGLSLTATTDVADDCPPDTLLKDCRLALPGEGVVMVNLRVHKCVEISANTGQHRLRLGCEFIGLPGTRLAMIERYIARIERERSARDSGLAD